MNRTTGVDFVRQVERAIRKLGYKMTLEPRGMPNRRLWSSDLMSLVRGSRYRPDILVQKGEKFAIIELKVRSVLLGSVMQAHRYAEYFNGVVIICTPDDVFSGIPGSVRDFAKEQCVGLCPLSEIGKTLAEVLD